ncbi:MAG: 3'(2'),5'-bisphosphate nucleotidase CysQ [Candidatus Scalindua sp.]|jgi:3'(2'), 5'-bisphosphate nucleotidase|nr:3'(2'),5'-bisphosphate nucleotidase CysQ [Candidatus Scalindua sp.]MBT5304732.1 3'(2'),5'-bisphosphate nucleotidase CysQ [Candidatus Scalindua sp.]MBT6049531.1 3'(2'),5'-bisphosphate nucleotidase CysQ [Candidatus Scalindua sp.]MBT6228140.1 3'(2'),5'-bisphosphate nucleotidase CysQ [Candidatus Scalindua sp.]MBT6561534.1 3'(2'),5'-bisphosphate nucleotidase CysQ [Candidatus Scalindua sp.]
MDKIQYDKLILTAILAAKRAGEAILEVYGSDFAVEQKDDKSPLTLADTRSHEIIADVLEQTITVNNSTVPILSEEGRDTPYEERKRWEYFWLVDPLDGTKEFVKRNGEFTVNIALMHRDKPVLGIIYVPVTDVFYFAALNFGSYKLESSDILTDDLSIKELIDKSQRLPLSNDINTPFTVVGSRSHTSEEFTEFVKQLNAKYEKVEFISSGSSLKLCLVAEGIADTYPRFGPTMEWDTAAGQAIVEQAEGKVINTQTNEPLSYNKSNLLNPFFIVSRQGLCLD